MYTSVVFLSAITLAATVAAQSTDCTNASVSSCLLSAYPTGIVTSAGPSTTEVNCGDQACVCSAMSLENECYKTWCPGVSIGADFESMYASQCGGASPTGAPTGSATITSDTAGAKTTTPTSTGASTASTSKAGVAGMADVVPAGSLLALLVGVVINL